MSYLYSKNNSPEDRFEQIAIGSDVGAVLLLRKGRTYDLSETEAARARMYVDMVSSEDPPTDGGSTGGIQYVRAFITNLQPDDALFWSPEFAYWYNAPSTGGGGGGGGSLGLLQATTLLQSTTLLTAS